MYQIKYDDYIIYDPRHRDLALWDISVSLTVNSSGSMSFVMSESHPYYSKMSRMKGIVRLISDGAVIYAGRIYSDTADTYNRHTIQTEGLLSCLNDSLIAPFNYPDEFDVTGDNTVEFFLNWLLSQHNSQVSDEQKLYLGNVTVADSNDYIARSNDNYATSWSVLSDKLTGSSLGGYILPRYEDGKVYIDYLSEFTDVCTQPIEFAENLLTVSNNVDGEETYSAILPIGADGLTIEDVEDGAITDDLVKDGKIIYSVSGREKYGYITSLQTWDDVTEASNLVTKASQLLTSDGIYLAQTITVNAADLSFLQDTGKFAVGQLVTVTSKPHGLTAVYPITSMSFNPQKPQDLTITLGETTQTNATLFARTNNIATTAHEIATGAKSSATTNANDIDQLQSVTEEYASLLAQTEQEILAKVQAMYVTQDTLQTTTESITSSIDLKADSLTTLFESQLATAQNATSATFDNYRYLLTWIRETAAGIDIGRSDSKITMHLDNDSLDFSDSGYPVSYLSDEKLLIHDGEIENSLILGKFAFIPRKTSKNLSLVRLED